MRAGGFVLGGDEACQVFSVSLEISLRLKKVVLINEAQNMSPLEITGNTQNRFVQAAVLLYLLDPVRGEPTTHGLDHDHNEIEPHREYLLKRKFLDSFALVCAIKKNGDTVSAASLEEGQPEGTILRVVSNNGIADSTLHELRELVGILNAVASGGK